MSPWEWKPSLGPWSRRLRSFCARPELAGFAGNGADPLHRELLNAIDEGADWLWHPFTSSLTPAGQQSRFSEVQLAGWVALHARDQDGAIDVPSATWIWSRTGARHLIDGRIAVRDLAAIMDADGAAASASSDHAFPTLLISEGISSAEIEAERRLGRELERGLPDVVDWIASAARMATPLPSSAGSSSFESSSSPSEFGTFSYSAGGDLMQLLEAAVHESAHLYLYRAECAGPLVDPACTGLFPSPLRSDVRPLRGILLAAHACAYMAAAFAYASSSGIEDPGRCLAQRDESLDLFQAAASVLAGARQYLTGVGQAFLDETAKVSNYARQF